MLLTEEHERRRIEGPNFKSYTIHSLLSSSFSYLYLAFEHTTERWVVLKALDFTLINRKSKLFTLFHQEHKNLQLLTSFKIEPTLLDYIEDDGWVCFVMPYYEMGSLREYMSAGFMCDEEVGRILLLLCDALVRIQQQGLIHRDLKPENIMFTGHGKSMVLIDYGLAHYQGDSAFIDLQLNTDAVFFGTLNYCAPELIKGECATSVSDMYSVGVILYEMLTNTLPYPDEDSISVLYKHCEESIPCLPLHRANWQPLLDCLLEKNPNKRVQNAEALSLLVVPHSL